MRWKRIGYDHKDLQAKDKGRLISLVYDFQERRMSEYRTDYEVTEGPMRDWHLCPGVIKYWLKDKPDDPPYANIRTMSLERIGQYELMSCKTAHQYYHRQYGRMFTIQLRLDHDRARFWHQIQRATLDQLRALSNQSGHRIDRWNFDPITKPNF
jgi:hypothetical protein